jgi:hypothetical protein
VGEKWRRRITLFKWRWCSTLWDTRSSFSFMVVRSGNIHVIESNSSCRRSIMFFLICGIDPFLDLRQRSGRWNDHDGNGHGRKAFCAVRHIDE